MLFYICVLGVIIMVHALAVFCIIIAHMDSTTKQLSDKLDRLLKEQDDSNTD